MTEKKQDSIRQLALAEEAKFKSKIVKIPIGGKEVEVEFREPTGGKKGAILHESQKIVMKGNEQIVTIDTQTMNIRTLIATAHDPATGEAIFSRNDFDTLKNKPNSWLEKWLKPALEIFGEKDVEEEVKN